MDWLKDHVVLLAVISMGMGTMGLVGGALFAIRLPADYFTRPPSDSGDAQKKSGTTPVALMILKNIVGVILILIGGVLSVPLVPGPGVLVLLMGLMLTSFPGKRKLVLKLLRTRFVLKPVNWLRHRAGRDEFITPNPR